MCPRNSRSDCSNVDFYHDRATESNLAELVQQDCRATLVALERTPKESARTRLAAKLRYDITPEIAQAKLATYLLSDNDLARRIVWALGETHNAKATGLLTSLVRAEDEHIAGVAVTALLKVNPTKLQELIPLGRSPTGHEMQRRLEDVKSELRKRGTFRCEVTFASPDNRETVDADLKRSLLTELTADNPPTLEVVEMRVPAAAGDLAGIWPRFFISLLGGLSAAALWSLGRSVFSALRKLRQHNARPVINWRTAVLLARGQLEREVAVNCKVVRAIRLGPTLYLDAYDVYDAHFLVEFQDNKRSYTIVLSTDGQVTGFYKHTIPKHTALGKEQQ